MLDSAMHVKDASSSSSRPADGNGSNLTLAGKLGSVAFGISWVVAFGVIFYAVESIKAFGGSRHALWAWCALVSAAYQCLGIVVLPILLSYPGRTPTAKTKFTEVAELIGDAYGYSLSCLWLVSALLASVEQPSCNVESGWWKALELSRQSQTTNSDLTRFCNETLTAVSLASLNAILFIGLSLTSLVLPMEKGEVTPLDRLRQAILSRKGQCSIPERKQLLEHPGA
ncbi:hypothetical protein CALCODRAFT_504115 [Calocera cornea HHB12733]|uniref:MARVEL domain-containing protein n=1 Tax=Calocera cornea HHB12733 TaxID=1353952 RepID=A0A165CKP8_9BASI|nr:hypothetical protein CALCODRAFT_504115 [Calocera cornea HHB12733]